MRCLVILSLLLLTSCSSVSLSDLSTGTGAVAGAAVGAATGIGLPATVTLTTVGATVGAVAVEDEATNAEILEQIPEEQRAEVAKTQAFWMFVEHFLEWIVGAVVALIVIAWLIPGPQFKWRKSNAESYSSRNRARHRRTY